MGIQNGGIQRLISLRNIPLVSISFFVNTGKFMVQPGSMDENNIVKLCTNFALIKQIIVKSVTVNITPALLTAQ